MELSRQTSHTKFDIKFHLIWTTKYRKPILVGKLGLRLRELIREICQTEDVQILRGHISKDHVHLFVSVVPQLSISKLAQYLKGKSSRKLLQEFPSLKKDFWGQHLWSRGFYAVTSGTITDELVMEYIRNQDEDQIKRGDDFTVLEA